MNLTHLAAIGSVFTVIITVWPRIVVPLGVTSVTIPTGGLIIAVLGAAAGGIAWLIWRRRDGFRSRPYPRTF
jgi:hypothetical protein